MERQGPVNGSRYDEYQPHPIKGLWGLIHEVKGLHETPETDGQRKTIIQGMGRVPRKSKIWKTGGLTSGVQST